MLENLGDVLKDAIFLKNMSQKQVAQILNIAPQTLNSYLNNHRLPDLKIFCHLVKLLEIDPFKALGIYMKKPILSDPKDNKMYETLKNLDLSQKNLILDVMLLLQEMNQVIQELKELR